MKKIKKEVATSKNHSVGKHKVRIGTLNNNEFLIVDGKEQFFYSSREGFTLVNNAYRSPEKTLFCAVKKYLK